MVIGKSCFAAALNPHQAKGTISCDMNCEEETLPVSKRRAGIFWTHGLRFVTEVTSRTVLRVFHSFSRECACVRLVVVTVPVPSVPGPPRPPVNLVEPRYWRLRCQPLPTSRNKSLLVFFYQTGRTIITRARLFIPLRFRTGTNHHYDAVSPQVFRSCYAFLCLH